MGKGKALFWLGAGVGALMAVRANARKKREYDFVGRTVLITGGSRGLGLILARQFAARGANVALVARAADALDRASEELKMYGDRLFTFPCDVTEPGQVNQMVGAVRARFGKIDVLVNNAGVIEVGPMETMTLADYEEAMRTHFWAPLHLTLAVQDEMKQRKSGRIVNISSFGGKVSVPHMLPYSASKHALDGFSTGLRAELARDNVYVTTVSPGLLRTGSHVNAQFKSQNQLEYALFSLGNANPLLSADADRAADQIIEACKYGDAELVISLPAQIATAFQALFPNLTADLAGMANRVLPGPGGIGADKVSGKESQTRLSPSILTVLSDSQVARNNE